MGWIICCMQEIGRHAQPLSQWYLAALATVMLISAYGASTTSWYYEIVFLMVPAWMALGIYWLVRIVLAVTSTGWAPLRRHWFRWLLTPIVFSAMVAALAVDGPLRVRFTLSESSLQAYAEIIAAGGHAEPGCKWLGLYYVCRSERIEGGALLVVKDIGMMERMGFAWLPGGQEPSDDGADNEYTPFTGPWWGWEGWDGL
jgi:hypothetical protein